MRADVELAAVDAVTGDPLTGVGFRLDDETLPDTSKDGKAAAVIDPGTTIGKSLRGTPTTFPQKGNRFWWTAANLAHARADPHPLCKEDL